MNENGQQISLQQLRALVALGECGSFTVAADRLELTQPSVSHLIRRLEEGVGLALVARGRGLRLTTEGGALAEVARRAIHAIDAAVHDCRAKSALASGTVSIAVGSLSAATLLPSLLSEFQRRHPALEPRIIDCTVEEIKARLLAREAEIGIGAYERLDDPELRTESLWAGPIGVFSLRNHPISRARNVDARELSRHACIQVNPQAPPWLAVNRALGQAGVRPKVVHRVRLISTAIGMLQAGMGVALLPRLATMQMPRGLVFTPLKDPSIRWEISAIRLANEPPSSAALAFLAMARTMKKDFARL
ncbi:MAG: LysR family transcriptional regulator [Burkholderiaceae bacterium]|nr:LysR family transcriptional regulator [Burkholderiaceae bacterium]